MPSGDRDTKMGWDIGDDEDFDVGDEIVGDDDVEALLGAVMPRGARRGAALRRAIAAKRVASGTLVKQTRPDKARDYPLSLDSVTTIAAAATASITTRPQVLFRAERLVIGNAIAPSFLVNDLKIGKNSQFVNAGSLPGEAFSNLSVGVTLKMDTAQVGNDIVINVTNTSAGALRFVAAILGSAVE